MKRLLLIDPDDGSRGAIAARLRGDGHEVLETDEQKALALYREGIDAVLVWNGGDAARAAALLDALKRDGRPPVLFFAPAVTGAATCAPAPPGAELVGESTAMRDLRATVRRLARRPRTHVLVGGERGSGKLAFARELHRSTAGAQFMLAAPERLRSLLDSGLGELGRDGGTLYVPNVCSVPKAEQRRLAAWLVERDDRGGPPVRLVAGATLGPEELPFDCVRRDVVHPDLSMRLPVALELVPLRRRGSDVPLLVRHFLRTWSSAANLAEPQITDAALNELTAHAWPGNLRELANVLECAAATASGIIDVAQLPALGRRAAVFDYELPREGIDFSEFERAVLAQALRRAGGNQTRAASLLGLTRDQIRYRMSKFGLVGEIPLRFRMEPEGQTS